MEFSEVVRNRRSVRQYEPTPINDGDLEYILNAGLYAPSAANYQPWYFVVVRSQEEIEKLRAIMQQVSVEVAGAIQERFGKHPAVVEETSRYIRNMGGAPVCILVFQLKTEYKVSTIEQSISAAVENIMLAAEDRGIGSCWLSAPTETSLKKMLQDTYAPDKGHLVAAVTLGYAQKKPVEPPRKSGRYIII